MKQIFFPKGGDQVAAREHASAKHFGTNDTNMMAAKLADFPVPARLPEQLPTALVNTARQ